MKNSRSSKKNPFEVKKANQERRETLENKDLEVKRAKQGFLGVTVKMELVLILERTEIGGLEMLIQEDRRRDLKEKQEKRATSGNRDLLVKKVIQERRENGENQGYKALQEKMESHHILEKMEPGGSGRQIPEFLQAEKMV